MTANEGLSWWEKVRFFIRIRQRLRAGVGRLRDGWLQILQTALAAVVAWLLAVLVLGHEQPVFAPIVTVISLGLAVGQRGRRVIELVLGVAFGVAIAELVVFVTGVGAVQIGLIVALAMTAAIFFGRGELGVIEAAISAMILMAVDLPTGGDFRPTASSRRWSAGALRWPSTRCCRSTPRSWSRGRHIQSSTNRSPCSKR